MAAPIGNQFWKLRSKHGRDRLFATPELLYEAACEYFEWCDSHPEYITEQKKGNQTIKISIKQGKNAEQQGDLAEQINESGLIKLPIKRPYTIQGLCLYCDCNTMFLSQFEASLKGKTDKLSKDFSIVIDTIKEIIYNQKYSGAAMGIFNANIIARDLGLVDKKEVDAEVKVSEITGMKVL